MKMQRVFVAVADDLQNFPIKILIPETTSNEEYSMKIDSDEIIKLIGGNL